MKKILSFVIGFLIICASTQAEEKKLIVEKQLIGILGAVSGSVSIESKVLKTGDKIYLGQTILAGADSGAQLLLLDQSTFTIGSDSEVVMDTFIYDPKNNNGKIISIVKKGSLKVISGLISKKNPDNLIVKVPEGTLGSRGTEFQTIVNKKQKVTKTLLIGPGKNNTLGLRPGKVLVSNKHGNTMLNKPYSFTSMKKGSAPDKAKKITKKQLKQFNKKMKTLRVARKEGMTKEERKTMRKEIKQQLKEQGFEKEEIKALIKENIQKDKEKKLERVKIEQKEIEGVEEIETPEEGITSDQQQAETTKPETVKPEAKTEKQKDKKAIKKEKGKKKKGVKKKKGKKKKLTKKQKAKKKKAARKKKIAKKKAAKKKKALKKKKGKKKKAVKNKKGKKKKAVKKKKGKKKKAVKKKKGKKKKAVKKKKVAKKKKAIKKKKVAKKKKAIKKKKKVKKKKAKKVVKKKVAKKKKKAKNKRRRKK